MKLTHRLLGATLGLLLCGLGAVPTAQAAPAVLTLAVAESPYAAPVLVAEAQGYFAAEGLALKLVRCAIGRVCLKQLLDGHAHLATVADTPITMASFTRRDFAVVATMATSGREMRMVVRGDRGISAPRDLKGRRVGTLTGTSAHYFVESYLLFHGMAMADITLVPLDAADPTGPLVRGEIDAAALFDPHVRRALNALGARGVALPTPGFFTITFNLVSVPASAGVSDDDLVKLLRAVQRGVAFIHAEPARARALVAAAAKVDDTELAATWPAFAFRLDLAQPLITSLEAQARWARRAGLVDSALPMPDYLHLVRTEPLRRLDARAMRLVQ